LEGDALLIVKRTAGGFATTATVAPAGSATTSSPLRRRCSLHIELAGHAEERRRLHIASSASRTTSASH